jgi:hypothetical protein
VSSPPSSRSASAGTPRTHTFFRACTILLDDVRKAIAENISEEDGLKAIP